MLRRRRIQALLAVGVVFGVGTASTVAAWTDTEAASSSFAASVFDTQSQTAGTPEFTSADGKFSFRPRGRILLDLATTTGSANSRSTSHQASTTWTGMPIAKAITAQRR